MVVVTRELKKIKQTVPLCWPRRSGKMKLTATPGLQGDGRNQNSPGVGGGEIGADKVKLYSSLSYSRYSRPIPGMFTAERVKTPPVHPGLGWVASRENAGKSSVVEENVSKSCKDHPTIVYR